MEFASLIIEPVVKALTGHITQKLRNLTSSADRVKKMITKWEVLDGQRTGIENRVKENEVNIRKIPPCVPGWLKEVEKIKEDVDNIPHNNIGCFNVKKKYLAGRNALRVTEDIERLIGDGSGISSDPIWREPKGCLGRVDSKIPASTSTPGVSVFNSREKTFNDALKFLDQDDDTARVVALCGMGGVGKTTLMKQLKKAVHDNKMFNCIVEVVIGTTPNLHTIQEKIAVQIGEPLTETEPREIYLSKRFEVLSKREEKTLVILDDVWKESKIKLEDIGLVSPLPNGVKLLLTSRDVNVCQQIAADVNAHSAFEVVDVAVLEEGEAQELFFRIAGISPKHDRDLNKIGCRIVKKCGCLPLAIELVAGILKCSKGQKKKLWQHTLDRLKKYELNNSVHKIVEISYNNLEREEDKAILLLCGLFLEDSNIPIEDLTRYAWGLKLLNNVHTMEEARGSIEISVSNLKNAYLLMDGDNLHSNFVKLHDIVLAFVVGTVSKGGEEGCWIIHHEDDFSNWSTEADNKSQSCNQISLACKGMSEFLVHFKFPNLRVLKLMQGDDSQRFPQDFYVGMEKLQVIAFEKLKYPLVPTSFQCSANLRTLCLDQCSLMFDLACIGDLSNLEVLSFANSGITILPSTFGNLKKLRLLDVTGCCNLVIDDGVLKSLVKLEELYMIPYDEKVCFTDNNSREFAERSKNLKRFKLSVGCSFAEGREHVQAYKVDMHSYENSLKLVTNREELLKSKINELFKITDALYLQVNDMNSLEAVEIPHPPRYSSFYNLRLLVVSECTELKYLFTPSVAKNLSKLEYLDISRCPIMEAVIDTGDNGFNIVKFSNLKYLRLNRLPNLLCFCNNDYVIELPCLVELQLRGLKSCTSIYPSSASSSVSSNISRMQSFFHKEDATPKLEKLFVSDMEKLKEIWPPQFTGSNVRMLKELRVDDCAEMKYLFTPNVATNLSELEYLRISSCDAMEAVIHSENDGSGTIKFSNLKYLRLAKLPNLLHFCNNVDVIELPCLMELQLEGLPKITSIYHDSATSFVSSNISPTQSFLNKQNATPKLEKLVVSDMDNLKEILPPQFRISNLCPLRELTVVGCGSIEVLFNMDFGEIEQLSSSLRSIKVKRCDSLLKLFSCNPFPFLSNLEVLNVESCRSIEVLFDIDSGLTGNIGEQICTSSLRSIKVDRCNSLVNLLPSNPMPLFNHLEELEVKECASIEVIFDIDMGCVGEMDKVSSSRLRRIYLEELGKLREVWRIKDAGNNLIHGFEAVESIYIERCERFENLITPTTTNLDMRALKQVIIQLCGTRRERKIELVEKEKEISKIAFPSSLLPTFHNLHNLDLLESYEDVEVVFEITSPISRESPHNTQQQLIILPNLEVLVLRNLKKMSHVWKCNWNELILQKQPSQSSFHNLTTIWMSYCNSVKYLFSPLMVKLLSSLKEIDIQDCEAIEEVISNRDDEDVSINSHTTASVGMVFPRLKSLRLDNLPNFVGFFLGKNEFRWPALEKVVIGECPQITVFTYGQSTAPELKFINTSFGKHSVECGLNFHVTTTSHQARLPSSESSSSYHPTTMKRLPWSHHNLIEVDMIVYNPSGGQTLFSSDEVSQLQKLETVRCSYCRDIEQIFDSQTDAEIPNLRQVDLVYLTSLKYIWKSKQGTELKFPNLTRLSINECHSLEYVFTCSMVGSILQLQELHISRCKRMKVIVKGEEEECDAIVNANVVFPCLKSLKLESLESLEGFCLGKEAFEFPSLDTLEIRSCSKMTVFTKGDLSAPKLHSIPSLLKR